MRTLSSSGILELWERGVGLHPLDRGLLALSVADPPSTGNVADWPLGRRNRALLDLYASWFGHQLQGWTACPDCEEKVEFELDARSLSAVESPCMPQGPVRVGEQSFRLPTSRDLAEVAASDSKMAPVWLLERCKVSGPESGWTDERLELVGESLASADPMAETRLALTCPACSREWDDTLEVVSFVWAEVEARARRLLWEVHSLASAYGWAESETLAMSSARRAMYLEMVHA